jgi:amino acid transporter
MTITDGAIICTTLGVAFWMLMPRLRNSTTWLATVTPLASIIGSGFLVAAPLLAVIAGNNAPIAMLAIVILAFCLGGVIRFNIIHLEPALEDRVHTPYSVFLLEKISNITLSVAYIVSVAFYLRLLASFVLHNSEVGEKGDLHANLITTAILLFIGLTGLLRGLRTLEKLESISVILKLAIIAGLIIGLAMFDFQTLGEAVTHEIPALDVSDFEKIRMLAGIHLRQLKRAIQVSSRDSRP